jgi:three-Cys-motif partner protein
MSSVKHGTTWPADQHTLAKIEILRGYLNAFFPILGTTRRGQRIMFVDGFAGPGEYTNSPEGSPIAALRAADHAIKQNSQRWIAGGIHCAFIEPEPLRCANLRELVKNATVSPMVTAEVFEANFVDGIAHLKQKHPRFFNAEEPLFVFIDPFGATGVPFKTVAAILASRTSEVLINLDADGIARNMHNAELLTSAFGDDSWRSALSTSDFKKLCQQILELYKAKLRALPRVDFVFSFEMRGSNDLLNYHLVFASQISLGLEKMKEAMQAIDKTGRYCFSDGAIGESILFDFKDAKEFAAKLHKQFIGQTLVYPPIKKFTLNETPFINPIAMLKVLDQNGQITVTRHNPASKALNETEVKSVAFLATSRPVPKASPVHVQGALFGD